MHAKDAKSVAGFFSIFTRITLFIVILFLFLLLILILILYHLQTETVF